MTTLNLTANGKTQECILAYLQEHASEMLAEKINNGVPIEKNGQTLTNKKDLDGFMSYACDEARKIAEKGKTSACVEDAIVYGWAMHYFEEDDIIGKLYDADGNEYKPAKNKTKPVVSSATIAHTPPAPVRKEKPQLSLFDLMTKLSNPSESSATDTVLPQEPKPEPKVEIAGIHRPVHTRLAHRDRDFRPSASIEKAPTDCSVEASYTKKSRRKVSSSSRGKFRNIRQP